jgi:hypothetical protein
MAICAVRWNSGDTVLRSIGVRDGYTRARSALGRLLSPSDMEPLTSTWDEPLLFRRTKLPLPLHLHYDKPCKA